MSFTVTEAFVEQFRDNLMMLSQQKGSKLMGGVRLENITGKAHYFERLGATEAVKRTSRHGDTPLISTPHSRRKVSIEDWEWADLLDKQDEIRLLIQPTNPYALAGSYALGRTCDDVILAAASGNAYSGESGGTTVALPASQRDLEGGTDGLTKGKLIDARTTLLAADVDPDFDTLHIAVHPNQIKNLLNDTTITSADYNTIRGLVTGDPVAANGFMGFQWHVTTRVPYKSGSSTLRDVTVWAESGLGLAVGQNIEVSVDKRPDKSNATQVYASMSIGATRIEDEKIVIVECYDA